MTGFEAAAAELGILESEAFTRRMTAVIAAAVRRDMAAVNSSVAVQNPSWNYLLLVASSLTANQTETAQDTALRIAQGCLTDPDATTNQREAAALLLERLGNLPALALATSRKLLDEQRWSTVPTDLALDATRRRLELSIDLGQRGTFESNPFQRDFWSLAGRNRWLSVSAPTSAGKTRIVREWIAHLFRERDEFRAAYIAPTRALVQEVSGSLAAQLEKNVRIHTLPWDPDIGQFPREMYVVTQERMHLLQQRHGFAPQFVFVDEAQSVGDRSRGILLSSVLDEAVTRRPDAQIIFASPLTSNPEVMLGGAPDGANTAALLSETVTVNQNLLLVRQIPRKPSEFSVDLSVRGSGVRIGEFSIAATRAAEGQRLAFISAALGGDSGNIVYANGPGTAEKFANQLFDILGPAAEVTSAEISEAAEFVRGSVHPNYALATVIRRGIGFHYGDIPLPVKTLIEDLFRAGHLKYLVCTSTLLEGVNLPCKNIFMRGPRKGMGNPMTASDFWNLAGRAGRWGTEFQGNIVCIDTHDKKQWPQPPGPRTRGVIRKSAEAPLVAPEALIDYIATGAPAASDEVPEELEAEFSFLAGRSMQGRSIRELYGLEAVVPGPVQDLQRAVDDAIADIELPSEICRRHAGISPLSMENLFRHLVSRDDIELLPLVPPETDDALDVYKQALDIVNVYLGGPFDNDRRRFALSRLIVNWMKGVPLARLIDFRLGWLRDQGQKPNTAAVIRQVMSDVEKIARFQAPKFLACYNDIVLAALSDAGRSLPEQPDITMMLELGVPRFTEMSLINLGLSRASAMSVSEFMASPEMTSAACLAWLRGRDVATLGLPDFALREIRRLLEADDPGSGGDG